MKKTAFISILLSAVLCCSFILSGCSNLSSSQQEESTVSVDDLENEISALQIELNKYTAVYDDSLKKSINKYCANYLTFDGKLDTKNVKKIMNYLTDSYYNELISQPFNEGEQTEDDYSQSTAVDTLYYENMSELINEQITITSTDVIAVCYQTVIANDSADSSSIVYRFSMQKKDSSWVINSVDVLT